MSEPVEHADVQHSALAESAPEYQSLSRAAALALALGLASPVSLVHPVFLIVPAAAVGAGSLALAHIRRSDNALVGSGLARAGLALAIGWTIAAGVRTAVRDAMLRSQAVEHARIWMTLLAEGRIEEAQQHLGANATSSLGPPPTPDGKPPADPGATEQIIFERLRDNPLSQRLAAMPPPLAVDVQTLEGPFFEAQRTIVIATYSVGARDKPPVRVELRSVRSPTYEQQQRPWRIDHWEIVPDDGAGARPGSP